MARNRVLGTEIHRRNFDEVVGIFFSPNTNVFIGFISSTCVCNRSLYTLPNSVVFSQGEREREREREHANCNFRRALFIAHLVQAVRLLLKFYTFIEKEE